MRVSLLFLFVILFSCRQGPELTDDTTDSSKTAECLDQGMVVCAHPLASDIGLEVMKQGGNAFDAAVATHFALAVVYPRAGNIGGGGFAVIHHADSGHYSLDFRERAPLTGHRDMYLDEDGAVIPQASRLGHLAVGTPGSVDGMWALHQRFGSLPWPELISYSVQLAESGFPITHYESVALNNADSLFRLVNEGSIPFLKEGGWQADEMLVQTELARTLERIQQYGRDGFYLGETAEAIVQEMREGGGMLGEEDLYTYHSVWREPLVGDFKGHEVVSMGPPSSGGIALLQLLEGTEQWGLDTLSPEHPIRIHRMVELERRVYADRATHLGDMDFYPVPVQGLLDEDYLEGRFKDISDKKATPSDEVEAGEIRRLSEETTHYSIIDGQGNAVSVTTTLNGRYGSKVVVDGTGIILNNEMDDFSVKPGVPNMFGLVGGEANAIAPGKRMLSSMTPTIVLKDGEPKLVIGTPGGSTIITSVYQVMLNTLMDGMSLEEAITRKRFHHQWLPDRIYHESDWSDTDTRQYLEGLGHELKSRSPIGKVDAILVSEEGCYIGLGDPRGDDMASGY